MCSIWSLGCVSCNIDQSLLLELQPQVAQQRLVLVTCFPIEIDQTIRMISGDLRCGVRCDLAAPLIPVARGIADGLPKARRAHMNLIRTTYYFDLEGLVIISTSHPPCLP